MLRCKIRTIAMDFWASLEHKIYYKYNKKVPGQLLNELKEAADSAAQLDEKMERIRTELDEIKEYGPKDELPEILIDNERFHLPYDFLALQISSLE